MGFPIWHAPNVRATGARHRSCSPDDIVGVVRSADPHGSVWPRAACSLHSMTWERGMAPRGRCSHIHHPHSEQLICIISAFAPPPSAGPTSSAVPARAGQALPLRSSKSSCPARCMTSPGTSNRRKVVAVLHQAPGLRVGSWSFVPAPTSRRLLMLPSSDHGPCGAGARHAAGAAPLSACSCLGALSGVRWQVPCVKVLGLRRRWSFAEAPVVAPWRGCGIVQGSPNEYHGHKLSLLAARSGLEQCQRMVLGGS